MTKRMGIASLGWASFAALLMMVGCSGSEGPEGPAGPPGQQGEQGEQGDPGAASVSAVSPARAFLDRRVQVQISGSGTAWDAAAPPTVDFGAGVTVESVQVASPTALIAVITVDGEAAMGARDVTVGDATYTGAFTVEQPLEATVVGTPAQGSIVIVLAEQKDVSTPFNSLETAVFNVSLGSNSAGGPNEASPYFVDALAFIDVKSDAGAMDLVIENGLQGSTVVSRAPDAVTVMERTATPVTSAMPGIATVTQPLGTVLFSYMAPADTKVVLSAFADNPDAAPAIALLPASGKFSELIEYGPSVNVPAGPASEYFLVYWDQSGETGYGIEIGANEVTPDEHEPNNDYMTATPATAGTTYELNIIPAGDQDYFAVALTAGATLTATIGDGELDECGSFFGGTIDSEIEIYDVDGTSSLMFNDDDPDTGTYCSSASIVAPADGTYFVRAAPSAQYCADCEYSYTLFIDVTPP